MESSVTKHQKNLSAFIHLSTFSKYLFPFGNFIMPLILWLSNKDQSNFIDHNGKQAINFQISILLYSICIGLITIPLFIFGVWDSLNFHDILNHNTHGLDLDFDNFFPFRRGFIFAGIWGVFALALFVLDIFCTIIATLRANEGIAYDYPLTINFLK